MITQLTILRDKLRADADAIDRVLTLLAPLSSPQSDDSDTSAPPCADTSVRRAYLVTPREPRRSKSQPARRPKAAVQTTGRGAIALKILGAIQGLTEPWDCQAVVTATALDRPVVSNGLSRLVRAGVIEKLTYRTYKRATPPTATLKPSPKESAYRSFRDSLDIKKSDPAEASV